MPHPAAVVDAHRSHWTDAELLFVGCQARRFGATAAETA